MAKRNFLEDGFPCEPTDIGNNAWYYVDSKGLHIITGRSGGEGHITWAKIKRALDDREKAPVRRSKPVTLKTRDNEGNMKIKTIASQHRRDFVAIYECEGCGTEHRGSGYDDTNFHQNVIPNMRCSACGKSAKDLGVDVRPLAPKHPDHLQL